ncbi:MAG: FliA/WhiG family RNA polymerase sigma factor [Candidatus Omnitrophica bacterium]|nr:FliA/WhiG family RNA polymerase sigma factor [Candidatus Omnitrophota bacterium]
MMGKAETVSREKILEYLPLVKKVASRIFLTIPKQLMDFEDLVGYGIMGLIEAVNTFDSEKGVKFSTYAFYRIRGAMLDALREMDWMPRTLRAKIHKVDGAAQELEGKLGRPAREDEIAEEVRMPVEEVSTLLLHSSQSEVISLENNLHNYLVRKTENFLSMNENELNDMKELLAGAIEKLGEKERLVLTLCYYEELNLKEIGSVLELSESRVCQILKSAVTHLKGNLNFLNGEI